MAQQIVFNIKVPIVLERKSDNLIVAACKPLDVFTQGENDAQAKRNIIEAIELFFVTSFEMGTLPEVLKQCGFKLSVQENHQAPDFPGEFINIPLPFICADQNNHGKCHA